MNGKEEKFAKSSSIVISPNCRKFALISTYSSMGSFSYQHAAWRRLKKNRGAMFGLVVITLSVVLAIFAYFVSPDPSPYENRIILEIGRQKPGHQQTFLKVRKEKNVPARGFLSWLFSGKEDKWYYLPIVNYQLRNDSIVVQKFIDESLSERQAYHKSLLDLKNPVVTKKFLLGTDTYGRDILSRLIVGIRVSLSVG